MQFNTALHSENARYSSYGASPALLEAPETTSAHTAVEIEPFSTNAATVIGQRSLDRETGGQFTLGQNYPNPYVGLTTIPFTLTNGGDVRLDLFDLGGRKMASILRKNMRPGQQSIQLNLSGLDLPVGDYVYQLQVTNSRGVYRQCKMMTAA